MKDFAALVAVSAWLAFTAFAVRYAWLLADKLIR